MKLVSFLRPTAELLINVNRRRERPLSDRFFGTAEDILQDSQGKTHYSSRPPLTLEPGPPLICSPSSPILHKRAQTWSRQMLSLKRPAGCIDQHQSAKIHCSPQRFHFGPSDSSKRQRHSDGCASASILRKFSAKISQKK